MNLESPPPRAALSVLSLPSVLSERVQTAAGIEAELRPATRLQFGYFQTNVALCLANADFPRVVSSDGRNTSEIVGSCCHRRVV